METGDQYFKLHDEFKAIMGYAILSQNKATETNQNAKDLFPLYLPNSSPRIDVTIAMKRFMGYWDNTGAEVLAPKPEGLSLREPIPTMSSESYVACGIGAPFPTTSKCLKQQQRRHTSHLLTVPACLV